MNFGAREGPGVAPGTANNASGIEGGALPQDHEDQLQLGIRIISSAFQNKVHVLEQEIRGLRMTCEEQRANVGALQKKNSALEVELMESHQRSQQLSEENKELFKMVGSLRKQIGRLDKLKSAVLTSIQDDAHHEAEIGDTRALMSEEYLRSATPMTSRDIAGLGPATSAGPPQQRQPQAPMQAQSDPYEAAGGGIFGGSGFGGTGPSMGGAAAPAGGGGATGQQSPPAADPMINGKQFFRQARSRLSYEAFNLFLASIKRLNNQTQTREETLEEARRIFGTELQDLYTDFENLLTRHGM